MYKLVSDTDELEAFTQNLSICTFRFVPKGLEAGREKTDEYLDKLNETIVGRLQKDGEVFVSNAVIDDVFLLRACIVNFRTTLDDIKAMIEIVLRIGHEVDDSMRPEGL